ncbi:MAG: hypothetical protein OEX02_08675 [Cyclobacteriaceae bacterium]|nr:hypothetical protein [Cyclobacteriaceae bacterium]
MIWYLGSIRTYRINWNKTLFSEHKIPYGTFAFRELLPTLFDVENNRFTLREMIDSLDAKGNFIGISNRLDLSVLDVSRMLQRAEEGDHFLLSSHSFSDMLLDTLGLEMDDSFLRNNNDAMESEEIDLTFTIKDFFTTDTSHIRLVNPILNKSAYIIRRSDLAAHFSFFDSTTTNIVAVNSGSQVLGVKINRGKGSIILTTLPLAFTNIYMLHGENNTLVSGLLSYLPDEQVHWTEFYQVGRAEPRTPLRYILSEEALRSALYLTLIALILFTFFEAKRKQRIIPVITPLTNETLNFVGTIGNLYMESKDHKSVAEKRINFFLDHVRNAYHLPTNDFCPEFYQKLSRKSGVDEKTISSLFSKITHIRIADSIEAGVLREFSDITDTFYTQENKRR